jgi:Protein of unknown function (DUF3293)
VSRAPGGEYPDPAGRAIYVPTAHNPGGQMASAMANASAEARLEAELERRGMMWWPAAGGDPSWTHVEPGAAVIGIEEATLSRWALSSGKTRSSGSLQPIAGSSGALTSESWRRDGPASRKLICPRQPMIMKAPKARYVG